MSFLKHKNAMKLLFFAPRFHTNQVNVVRILKEEGYSVTFHVERESIIEDYSTLKPVPIPFWEVQCFNRIYRINNLIKYYLKICKEEFNIIIIRDPNRISAILVAIMAKFLGIKIIFYTQMVINKDYTFLRRCIYNGLMYIFNAKWYSPVYGIRDKLIFNGISNLYYLPFPTELNFEKFVRNTNQVDTVQILSVGKFQNRKNHLLLIRAILFLKNILNIKFKVIGEVTTAEHEYEYKRVLSFIEEKNMNDIVSISTNVKPSLMSSFYKEADIFVLPSHSEPASISILEAMSFCLPVIVSDDCGNKDYVINDVTGYHFQKNNLWSLIEKIYLIASNSEKRINMSKETKKLVLSEYSKDYFISKFKTIIE